MSYEKKESVTFRLDNFIIKKLRTESEQEHISINALVRQILYDYAEWDAKAVEAGWMVFPKHALKVLIDDASEQTISRIAESMANFKKDMMLLMVGGNTLDGFLSVLRNRVKKSGFQIRESKDEDSTTIILQHDMGLNWSLLNKSMYEQTLHNMDHQVTITYTENTLVMLVKLKTTNPEAL